MPTSLVSRACQWLTVLSSCFWLGCSSDDPPEPGADASDQDASVTDAGAERDSGIQTEPDGAPCGQTGADCSSAPGASLPTDTSKCCSRRCGGTTGSNAVVCL